MTARNPSDAFAARCSVQHVPPDPPFFLENDGFLSVEVDNVALGGGTYILTPKPGLDLEKNLVDAQYRTNDLAGIDLGVMFQGRVLANPGPGKILVARFRVVPDNSFVDGPFEVAVIDVTGRE